MNTYTYTGFKVIWWIVFAGSVLQFLVLSAGILILKDGEERFHISSICSPLHIVPNSKSSYKLWPNDRKCSNFSTHFGQDLPLRFLVSYPRSGNSWFRYLIEGATGYFTGSLYCDENLYSKGFLGEKEPYNSKRVILVKSHGDTIGQIRTNISTSTPTILIIRNPFESILSYWSLVKSDSHFSELKQDDFNSERYHRFVRNQIHYWGKVNSERLMNSGPLLVIFFENLVQNPMKEIKRVFNFLGLTENEERIQCLAAHINGPMKRLHKKVNPFTPEERKALRQSTRLVFQLAYRRGIKVFPPEYNITKRFNFPVKQKSYTRI